MKKLFLSLIFVFSLLTITYGQEQPKDLEIKVIPLSTEDTQQTEQLYKEYQEAIKKWGEHKDKLRLKYLPNSNTGRVYGFSLNSYSYEMPYFVLSKDYRFLIVTKEFDHSNNWVNLGSVTPAVQTYPSLVW